MQRKVEKNLQRFCTNCGSPKMKSWDDLTADEKFMAERLTTTSGFSPEEKQHRRFCARCLYADSGVEMDKA